MVKIRLKRGGKKKYPIYRIVVTDVCSSRDGRSIEDVGTYNPNMNPGKVTLKTDRIMYRILQGAQLTNVVRRLCSKLGIMLCLHLIEGVRKGAITSKIASERFAVWKNANALQQNRGCHYEASMPVGSLIELMCNSEFVKPS